MLFGPGLLANDTDAEGDALTVGSVNGSSGNVGSEITLASGAHLTVAADEIGRAACRGGVESLGDGASATDSFTYSATDGTASSEEATVSITINVVIDVKVAAADAMTK